MKRSLSVVCVLVVLSLVASGAGAAAVAQLIPSAGPRGARCIVTGTDLNASAIAVTFPTSSASRAAATIVSRSADRIDLSVPPEAISGSVEVRDGSTLLGTFAFFVTADPPITTIGTLVVAGSGRQPIKGPVGNAVAPDGSIFLADTMHHQIKRVAVDGTVTVFAGSGRGGLTDGVGAAAELRGPQGVVFDAPRGVLYVADTDNHAIRRISMDGSVTTIAGSGRRGDADGVGVAAEFTLPGGIAVDASGNLYIADTGNHRIKRIAIDGVVTTIAGNGRAGSADGAGTQAQLRSPEGIAVAPAARFTSPTPATTWFAGFRTESSRPSPAACGRDSSTAPRSAPRSPGRADSRSTMPAISSSPTRAITSFAGSH